MSKSPPPAKKPAASKEASLLEEMIGCYRDILAGIEEIKERLSAIEAKQPRSMMEFGPDGKLKRFSTSGIEDELEPESEGEAAA